MLAYFNNDLIKSIRFIFGLYKCDEFEQIVQYVKNHRFDILDFCV